MEKKKNTPNPAPTPECERTQRRFEEALAGNQPAFQSIRKHLDRCPFCKMAWLELQDVERHLKDYIQEIEPSNLDDSSHAIMAAIQKVEEEREKTRPPRVPSPLPKIQVSKKPWILIFLTLAALLLWGLVECRRALRKRANASSLQETVQEFKTPSSSLPKTAEQEKTK